jgi:hypothetical protein
MPGSFVSAGERVVVDAGPAWARRLIDAALGLPPPDPAGPVDPVAQADPAGGPAGPATVRIRVQASRAPFPRDGLDPVTRGAYSDGRRTLLLDTGGSGFDILLVAGDLVAGDEELSVTARYRPSVRTRAVNRLLPTRFRLLAGQVLVHYPLLWRAGWRARVPLHASVVHTRGGTLLLAGPGGVGKSTVLVRLLAEEAVATADNLCCADRTSCYGLVEPLRTDADLAAGARTSDGRVAGARTSHGRVERPLPARVPALSPDRIVLLERGPRTAVTVAGPAEAARALVAGTYAAGELRRYWAFAATLALATGRGPAHPPIAEVAGGYADRLPCLRVRVGDGATVSAALLCGETRLRGGTR